MSIDPNTLVPSHFLWDFDGDVATITLNRPERKNPLTFDCYAELRDLFLELEHTPAVKCVVFTGAGGNFCSGGDVHEIIGPLTRMDDSGLLSFTRMTGDLVRTMRKCPQPIIAAVQGVCAGAGAIIAMASDLRLVHLEDLTPHYVRTLELWRERLLARADEAAALGFGPEFLRAWEYYFAYCEGGYAEGQLGDVHMLFARPAARVLPDPS